MTPEQSLERAVRAAGIPYGHWPYTQRLEGVAVGYRPREDEFPVSGGGRPLRVRVSYDLVVIRVPGAVREAESARFALYQALRSAGWAITGMGPETYVAEQKRHYWPVTAVRGFGLDAQGQPYDLTHADTEEEGTSHG